MTKICLAYAALLICCAGETNSRSAPTKTLLADAERALHAGPFSVMDKSAAPPSGNKHDYMSVGPYWWPDPSKPDGLPYIRHDGERNPARNSNDLDRRAFGEMMSAVDTLALAYRETAEERYAAHAAKLLRAWFLDPATKMNPNLDYGQAIPGIVTGRGTGIIDTAGLVDLTRSIGWLSKSKVWTEADAEGLKHWFRDYLTWLRTSKNGLDEAAAKNNHGTWYDAQVTAFALFTDQPELAKRVLEAAGAKRIATQIEPDGRQPLELARTKGFGYSTMNLRAMFELASFGTHVGVDLWHYQTPDGRGIRKALDFLAPYVDPAKPWPYAQLGGVTDGDRLQLGILLRRAALAYHDAHYERLLNRLPAQEVEANRIQLLWPKNSESSQGGLLH